jgi:hypothetical protein
LVIGVALVGLLTVRNNPLTPGDCSRWGRETDSLRTYSARNRIERIEQALQAYYLDRAAMPGEPGCALRGRVSCAPTDTVRSLGTLVRVSLRQLVATSSPEVRRTR